MKKSFRAIARPSRVSIAATARAASSECPPSAKKLAWAWSTRSPSSSLQIAASARSVSVVSGVRVASPTPPASSVSTQARGAGSAA